MCSHNKMALLRSGKYKGHTYEHVKNRDRQYCGWVLEACVEKPLPRDLRMFARHLEKEHGGLVRVGRRLASVGGVWSSFGRSSAWVGRRGWAKRCESVGAWAGEAWGGRRGWVTHEGPDCGL